MSTESIVNRVSQSIPSGFSEEQVQAALVKSAGAPTNVVEQLPVPMTAEQQRMGQIGSIEEQPVDYSELIDEAVKAAGWQDHQGLVVKPDSVDLIEFQDFKRQVIAAFKHIGVDTRKHFTE